LGIVRFPVRPLQLLNALFPILVTLSGIVNELKYYSLLCCNTAYLALSKKVLCSIMM
jgi:hypothetical protein